VLRKKQLDKIITNSPQGTIDVGVKIAAGLNIGDIIYLYGELGSGKTVLVKGICQGLGVKEDVTSSSFVIATEYRGRMSVSHIDLYRLDGKDVADLPIDEYILDNGITVIEWADRIGDKKENGLCINISILGDKKRELTFEDFRD
jgi:tRNA threonylcarbamoyladenosine biosynthesis protein TsaE